MSKKAQLVCPELKEELGGDRGEYGLNLKQIAASLKINDSIIAELFKEFFIPALRGGLENYRYLVQVKKIFDSKEVVDGKAMIVPRGRAAKCRHDSNVEKVLNILEYLEHETGKVGHSTTVIDYELAIRFIEEQLLPNNMIPRAEGYLKWLKIWGQGLKKEEVIPPMEYNDMLVVSEVPKPTPTQQNAVSTSLETTPDKLTPDKLTPDMLRSVADTWEALVKENIKLKSEIAVLSTGNLGEVLNGLIKRLGEENGTK